MFTSIASISLLVGLCVFGAALIYVAMVLVSDIRRRRLPVSNWLIQAAWTAVPVLVVAGVVLCAWVTSGSAR
ncbi:MAG: hypothetical protein ACE5IK_04930 [Acidobacteriota bacterium]